LKEPPRAEKEALLTENGLNTKAFRHLVFTIHFDLPLFENQGLVEPARQWLIVEYSGENRPVYTVIKMVL
jgi:hypothetical protein